MMPRTVVLSLLAIAAAGFYATSAVADASGVARRDVVSSIAAMGGEHVLASVHSLQSQAVGHRNMLEQSLRPEGPWWQDYFQLDEIRDFDMRSERVSQQHRGYSSSNWWLQNPGWDSQDYPDYVVAGGATASVINGRYARASSSNLQIAEEDFAFGPLGLLHTALTAADLHTEPDVIFHGFRHRVVAFTWHGYPVRLYLNGYTNLPALVQWTAPRPYDVFWSVWGDVTTRITYGMWTLEPDGLRYPRQWAIERNGLPDSDFTITSLTVNPLFNPAELTIPGDFSKNFLAHKLTIDNLPLGIGGSGAPAEIEPGLVHIPGAWNINLIRQPDGVVVLEGPLSSAYSVQVLAEAHKRYPSLPVKAVITTSDSWPHIGGLREYVARGIPIYALDLDKPILERLFNAPHTYRPDDLQKHRRTPIWRLIHARTVLGSGPNRLELIPYRTQTGERQTLVYFPQYRLLYTSDLFAPAVDPKWFTPEYLLEVRNAVTREHLAVDDIFGMHYDVTPWKTVLTALASFLAPKTAPPPPADPAALKPAIQPLAFFVGRWICEGKFVKSGKAISAMETFRPELDGNWLVMRHDDQAPFTWHSLEVWGYDAKTALFNYYNFDNFANARHYTSAGWSGDKLVWTWSTVAASSYVDRFVYERHGDAEYQVSYFSSKDGGPWTEGDTSICRRQ